MLQELCACELFVWDAESFDWRRSVSFVKCSIRYFGCYSVIVDVCFLAVYCTHNALQPLHVSHSQAGYGLKSSQIQDCMCETSVRNVNFLSPIIWESIAQLTESPYHLSCHYSDITALLYGASTPVLHPKNSRSIAQCTILILEAKFIPKPPATYSNHNFSSLLWMVYANAQANRLRQGILCL